MTWALTVFVDLIAAVGAGCVLSSLIYVNNMAAQQLANCQILTATSIKSLPANTIGQKETDVLTAVEGRALVFVVPIAAGTMHCL